MDHEKESGENVHNPLSCAKSLFISIAFCPYLFGLEASEFAELLIMQLVPSDIRHCFFPDVSES